MKRAVLLLPLLWLVGCRALPQVPTDSRPYAQVEEGLTLVFVDPELKEPELSAQRLQVRVSHAAHREDGSLLVEKQFTHGFERPFYSLSRVSKDGGVSILDQQGRVLDEALPAGFPDRVNTWTAPATARPEQRTRYTVIGRAAWAGAAILPKGADPIGVWVEARPPRGLRSRSLYLKGLGEVESLEERPGGLWVCVNRLQQRGFLDAPSTTPR